MPLIITLSGPVAVGKSVFIAELEKRYAVRHVSTRRYIQIRSGLPQEREALQKAGDELDRETNGEWVSDAADAAIKSDPASLLLIDSVRTPSQIDKLRDRFGAGNVLHIHLTAPEDILAQRYRLRTSEMHEFPEYSQLKASGTEANVQLLADIADILVDTSSGSPEQLVTGALQQRLPDARERLRLVDVLLGGQYGSEGKGNICAYLANEYQLMVRVGGPNAGHMVADPPYKFIQLPSGSGTNRDARVLIAAGSTIWIPQLMREMSDHPHLAPGRLVIDPQAMIIEEEDRHIESGALESISSTKQGVGARRQSG